MQTSIIASRLGICIAERYIGGAGERGKGRGYRGEHKAVGAGQTE